MAIEDGPDQTLDQSESLDSDEVRNDDGDTVVDPPDHWSEANSFGTTAREAAEGESLDLKLSEEEPDIAVEEDLDRPITEGLSSRIVGATGARSTAPRKTAAPSPDALASGLHRYSLGRTERVTVNLVLRPIGSVGPTASARARR
jgi:hypothetical protein